MRGILIAWRRCRMQGRRKDYREARRSRRRKCELALLARADVNGIAGVTHGLRGKIGRFLRGNEENIERPLGQHAGE